MTTTDHGARSPGSRVLGSPVLGSRRVRVALVAVAQLGLVGLAVAAPLSARLTGHEYRLRVAPVDPIDPFRGAYVALSYPGLAATTDGVTRDGSDGSEAGRGTVYVPLVADGDLWKGGTPARTAPAGPYLRCHDEGWRLRCGIESWFLPQAAAAEAGRALTAGTAVAVVRVDSGGHAALVDLRPAG